jgi:hypothetical protein
MKVYLAGNSQYVHIWNWIAKYHHKALLSYYYIVEANSFWNKTIKEMVRTDRKVDLFLDSGAFSAWTQKLQIDIKEYIAYIKEHAGLFKVYANLDVIGIGGKQPNKLTAEATLKNQKIMEKAGLSPLPCFHFGEPFEYLEYYVKNYEYLALGVAGNSGTTLIPWLDECFQKYICDENGLPKIKVHGFAVTSLKLMLRYPWYSVDSTSWVVTGRMGSIFVPRYKNGEWLYDENSWKIAVSGRSPSNKEAGKHITTLNPIEKRILTDYITQKGYKLGLSKFEFKDVNIELKPNEHWIERQEKGAAVRLAEVIVEEGISNNYKQRDEMNVIYFMDLEKSIQPWPWSFKRKGVGGFAI